MVTGARGREQGNVFYFILGIRAWQRYHGDRVLGKGSLGRDCEYGIRETEHGDMSNFLVTFYFQRNFVN